jgi:hypothetical protein
MFELFKLLWDFIVLRDAARKGKLKARVWVLAFAFLFVVYGIGLPIALFYVNHPTCFPLLVAAIILVAISFMVTAYLGFSWWREAPDGSANQK